jgi:anion-transporting  ArsA/GET3 family ATPase
MASLDATLTSADVLVCCGPGGVGKTTVSATLGLKAALEGRRVCVLTVDPARRLADALGIAVMGHEPSLVPGVTGGTLHAVMLDTSETFGDLIDRYAESPEQAAQIKSNRLYGSLASAMSGTQEYMAMEKLYELVGSGHYDLVVVDTPPTRNALDLLDAPRRLNSFLSNRIFRALLTPTKAYMKALSFATQALLSTIGKVAGADLVSDAVTFFQAFGGMETGFAERAHAIHERLRSPGTAFVLVTSPRTDAIEEARYFAERLAETGMRASGAIVNRIHPRFLAEPLPDDLLEAEGDLGALVANLVELEGVALDERRSLSALVRALAPAPVASLPLSDDEIHDLAGLTRLGNLLSEEILDSTAAGEPDDPR